MYKYLTCLCLLAFMAGSCRNTKPPMTQNQESTQLDFTAGPPTIVYKTKRDYSDKVAVIFNAEKTAIVAYPHPQDIAKKGNRVKPTVLAQGYLLDNQGLNENAAFTQYTFEEYAALAKAPTLAELKASIIDKEPFTELCHCGNRNQFTSLEQDLNQLITRRLVPCQSFTAHSKQR
ncbi:hypothetical protein [Adhaeribacter rhizoryzae]|uniref:Uncharacterized protein n=1 Tax=Adhaeribacter rhizoryzae TaxID=2607907 RepID=A0A5M6D7C0_9BACT|nr:hypothetical protein [Adhaeribacter rhizoryzae]KAA5543397.1 hypothetical protein F0145_17310 [Adhaeribacter rhizoryzae]